MQAAAALSANKDGAKRTQGVFFKTLSTPPSTAGRRGCHSINQRAHTGSGCEGRQAALGARGPVQRQLAARADKLGEFGVEALGDRGDKRGQQGGPQPVLVEQQTLGDGQVLAGGRCFLIADVNHIGPGAVVVVFQRRMLMGPGFVVGIHAMRKDHARHALARRGRRRGAAASAHMKVCPLVDALCRDQQRLNEHAQQHKPGHPTPSHPLR